jgi:hypothetical protein
MWHSARKPPFGTQLRTANVAGHDMIVNLKIQRAVLNSRTWLLAVTMQIDRENCRGTQRRWRCSKLAFLDSCVVIRGLSNYQVFFGFRM